MGDLPLLLLLAFIGLLIFGKRMPEVGRNLGHGITEFKRGLGGIGEELKSVQQSTVAPPRTDRALPPAPIAGQLAPTDGDARSELREEMRQLREELTAARAKLEEKSKA